MRNTRGKQAQQRKRWLRMTALGFLRLVVTHCSFPDRVSRGRLGRNSHQPVVKRGQKR